MSRLIPQAARLPAIGLVFGLTCYGVAYSNAPGGTTAEADAALAIIKPALGLVFGSLFVYNACGAYCSDEGPDDLEARTQVFADQLVEGYARESSLSFTAVSSRCRQRMVVYGCLLLLGGASLWGLIGISGYFNVAEDEYDQLRAVYAVGNHAATARVLINVQEADSPDRSAIINELNSALGQARTLHADRYPQPIQKMIERQRQKTRSDADVIKRWPAG